MPLDAAWMLTEKASAERKLPAREMQESCHCQPQSPLRRLEVRPRTERRAGAQGREKAASPGRERRACLGEVGYTEGRAPKRPVGAWPGVGEDQGRDPVRPVGLIISKVPLAPGISYS